MTVQRRRR